MVAHPSWNLASWAQHWAAHGNCELQFLFQPFQRSNLSNIVRISTIEHDRFFSTYLRALQRLYNLQYTASPSVSCKLYPSMCSAPSLEAFVRRQLLITLRRLIHPSLFSQSYPDWPGSLGFANNTLVLVLYSTQLAAVVLFCLLAVPLFQRTSCDAAVGGSCHPTLFIVRGQVVRWYWNFTTFFF